VSSSDLARATTQDGGASYPSADYLERVARSNSPTKQITVGILDSGAGGLTILQQCLVHAPGARYIYLADDKAFPYGIKDPTAVAQAVARSAALLHARGVEFLVIAGDTASALGAEAARRIFGQERVLDTVSTLPQAVAGLPNESRLVLLTTPAALRAGVHQQVLADLGFKDVLVISSESLAAAAQRVAIPDELTVAAVREAMAPVQTRNPDFLLVACTNALLQEGLLRRHAGQGVRLIDVREILGAATRDYVGVDESMRGRSDLILLSTGRTDELQRYAAERLLLPSVVIPAQTDTTTSAGIRATVDALATAFSKRDSNAIQGLMADDVRLTVCESAPRSLSRKHAVEAILRNRSKWADVKVVVRELNQSDEGVVAAGFLLGLESEGSPTCRDIFASIEIVDGRIAQLEFLMETKSS
jgi:glutamate racemase